MLDQFGFEWPWAIIALPLPWVFSILARGPRRTALRLVDSRLIAPLPSSHRLIGWRVQGPDGLALLVWFLLVAAAMRPQLIDLTAARPVSGRELIIGLDLSASMETQDLVVPPGRPQSRLQVAKAIAGEFIAGRLGDRVGVVVFGDRPYVLTPLTFDLDAAAAAVAGVELGLAGRETALGDAIALAARTARQYRESSRALVLLTDGAQTTGSLSPQQAIWLAQRERLRIYVIGIGAEAMTIVAPEGLRSINPSSGLDTETLTTIASQTGGAYWRATDTNGLAGAFSEINRLEPIASLVQTGRSVDLYRWPLLLALLLGVVKPLCGKARHVTFARRRRVYEDGSRAES